MQLKDRIAAVLARRPGTRQADIARVAGVSTASVADWMSGTTKSMKPEPARKLSAKYGCDQNWLMTGIGSASWGEGSSEATESSDSISPGPTLPEALRVVREHLAHANAEQAGRAGDALKLMATVPDSDRAFEQALAALKSIE